MSQNTGHRCLYTATHTAALLNIVFAWMDVSDPSYFISHDGHLPSGRVFLHAKSYKWHNQDP